MDRDKQRRIASKGGKAAHEKGTAHQWTSNEARAAGQKGGSASHVGNLRLPTRSRINKPEDGLSDAGSSERRVQSSGDWEHRKS